MVEKFHERFDLQIDLNEARQRFVNRVFNEIFGSFLFKNFSQDDRYYATLDIISRLGERYEYPGHLDHYVKNDFYKTLRALESLYQSCCSDVYKKRSFEALLASILEESEVNLGVQWKNGYFLRSGAELLDQKLVNDVLHWLRDKSYEDVLTPYEKGLRHFLEAEKRPEVLSDVITDTYEALEALAKIATNRPHNDLSANAELFIRTVKASDAYKTLLKDYIDYANRFRHSPRPTRPRPSLSLPEVESFLYLTGIFIRLAITGSPTEDVV
jgi:hypothetical protein